MVPRVLPPQSWRTSRSRPGCRPRLRARPPWCGPAWRRPGRTPRATPGPRRPQGATPGRTGGGTEQTSGSESPDRIASGKSSRTGGVGFSNSAKAASNTRCWKSASPGLPSGRPSGNSTASARGGRMRSATFRIGTITTVDSPAASNTCASVQTVRGHRGQTGVRTTTSTPSSSSFCAHAGPVSRRTSDTVSGWLPANA